METDGLDLHRLASQLVGEAFLRQIELERRDVWISWIEELDPGGGELVPGAEEAGAAGRRGLAREALVRQARPCLLLQAGPALARRVVEAQHDIRDRVEVEGVGVAGQVDAPARDDAGTLEGQVAFVAEVELEQAR